MNETERAAMLPELLIPWFSGHARRLPWREDREPYHVWLSEVMLQQTRVEAVKSYYARFLAKLPTIEALANAPQELLYKLWEGLGYYTRVRNLQTAARQIMSDHHGVFPTDYASVRALKGVGDYTAGAICSICFGLPTPAVDGNVLRVLSRLCEDSCPVNGDAAKKAARNTLSEVYPAGRCGDFTQALMELGATVCVPNGTPDCVQCPVRQICAAAEHGTVQRYPVRTEKKPRRVEKLTVFVMRCGNCAAVRKRGETGLLSGLWEYPNVPGQLSPVEAIKQAEDWGVHPKELIRQSERTHLFTHVQWDMRCYYLDCAEKSELFTWADKESMQRQIALPTAFRMWNEDSGTNS